MRPNDESVNRPDLEQPKTLWEAIHAILKASKEPIAIHDIVKAVADSDYPGNPTKLRVRSVLRRQTLFNRVIETHPHLYRLPKP